MDSEIGIRRPWLPGALSRVTIIEQLFRTTITSYCIMGEVTMMTAGRC